MSPLPDACRSRTGSLLRRPRGSGAGRYFLPRPGPWGKTSATLSPPPLAGEGQGGGAVVCSLSMDPRWSYLRTLECTACSAEVDAEAVYGVCPSCGKVLFARYDLADLKSAITPDDFLRRSWDMWRYHELLPVHDPAKVVTLGEGMTPLIRVSARVSDWLGFRGGLLRIKDEGKNPTGSFKARGMTAAISKAKELGVTDVALASAGNAGSASAAYAAAAGIQAHV